MLFKTLTLTTVSLLAFVAPMVAAIAVFTALAIMLCLVAAVALTAAWSGRAERREDARKVLLVLLRFFFQQKK